MATITLKGIIDEDFVNYKVPSMTLMFPHCDFKCGKTLCQNSSLYMAKDIEIPIDKLCERYVNNPITEAIVCQGMEPLDSFDELLRFLKTIRTKYDCADDVVLYTGYDKKEIEDKLSILKNYKNIIVKYGRFIPYGDRHFDEVLGVYLASSNQYAERL